MGDIATHRKRQKKVSVQWWRHGPPNRQDRESFQSRERLPENGTYGVPVPAAEPKPSLDLRRVRFSAFIRRALDLAKVRGMTVEQIENATGIGSSTFYRWRDGNWNRDPTPSAVRNFCTGTGASISEAYAALNWSESDAQRSAQPAPLIEDPDVRALMRKLTDPKTSAAEKAMFRRMIRSWVGRLEEEDQQ